MLPWIVGCRKICYGINNDMRGNKMLLGTNGANRTFTAHYLQLDWQKNISHYIFLQQKMNCNPCHTLGYPFCQLLTCLPSYGTLDPTRLCAKTNQRRCQPNPSTNSQDSIISFLPYSLNVSYKPTPKHNRLS